MSRFLNRISRRAVLGATAAVVIGSTAVTTLSQPAAAAGNSLYFAQGSDHVVVGANAAIYIDGTITFDANCQGGTRPGIDDFVYPATDVYIVPAGSAADGAGLVDAGGNGPNTIVGTGSGAFIGELIAVSYPSGPLGDGEYDVVYDTCQDGVVDFEDEIFFDAITVDVPDGEIPPVDASIRRVKDAAREEYAAWLSTHIGLTALFKFDDAKEIAACILAPSPGCLADVLAVIYDVDSVMAKSSDWIEGQTLNLVMNRAKNYGAIWQDPADPDYAQLPVLTPDVAREVPMGGAPLPDAVAALASPLAEEGALTEALLHALERYQGAQAAGDTQWAQVQAAAVADLSATLAEHLRTATDVQALRDALAADIDDVVADSAEAASTINRIRATGFTATERRSLRNRGLTTADITALEARFVADGRQVAPVASQVLAPFDQLLAARSEMAAALDESVAGWSALATELAARQDAVAVPMADAAGPYPFGSGTVTLDATASTTPAPTAITTYEWDTDGDGAFDDATGATPTVALTEPGSVAVRVTNDAGIAAVATAVVAGAAPAALPITATPADRAVTLTAPASQAFTATASGATSIEWMLDGTPVASGGSYTFTATGAADVGEHVVTVTAREGRRSVSTSWIVSVLLPDADGDGWTATSDCDDTRADVSPAGFERIGNGRDDDCDPATVDGPVGGVTGSVYTWGQRQSTGLLPLVDQPTPVPFPALGDQVIELESRLGGGAAVLADGTVRTWSSAAGLLGNGQNVASYTPVTVVNTTGTGVLTGVVEVSNDEGTALARRADGTVVAWGSNTNDQAGDGSGVDYRLSPVDVIDAVTGQPLAGVAQVESGETTSFGVMRDGTVRVWGVDHCNAGQGTVHHLHATTNPLFGNDVVQLSSGDSGGAIVLTRDGTVKVCSSYTPLLGRGPGSVTLANAQTPKPVVGFGPGSGAIDVAMGSSTVTALKADGTVWVWGRNLNNTLGVVGLAPDQIASVPMQVPLPPGAPVVDIEMDYAATTFATRADGTVLVWGANVLGGAGIADQTYNVAGTPEVGFGGTRVVAVANSMWNGLALVRPAEPASGDPVRPLHWIDASIGDGSIGESTGGTVSVSLSAAAPVDVTVGYEFDGAAGSVVVPAGATSAPVALSVADDALDEADEELAVTIASVADGVRVDDGIGLVTVVDDDVPPAISIADVTVAEGDTSLTDVALTVSLSAPAPTDVIVDATLTAGTARAGEDVQALAGSVLIPAGAASVTTHAYVVGDTMLEDDEAFEVVLSNPAGATLADGRATVTITDDEPIVVSVTSPSVVEGDSGITKATFTLTATQPPTPVAITIPWSVVPGTAEADVDVVTGGGSVTLTAAGQTGVVEIGVVGDDVVEPLAVETFRLGLGAITAGGRAVVVNDAPAARIADDDVVVVTVNAGADVTGDEGSALPISGLVTGLDAPTVTWSVDQPVCTVADPSALATTVTCTDEVSAVLMLTIDGSHSDTAALTVGNVAPSATITAPAPGTSVVAGTPVALAVGTADPGAGDTVTCTANWGDGAVTPCTSTHAYATAGTYPIVATVADGDGSTGSATVSVTVTPLTPVMQFDGFYAPVDNAPVVNVVKAGSTVPLKFSLGGDFGLAIFEPGYPASIRRSCYACPHSSLATPTTTPGASALTYDPATGRYQYNWKTSKSWAGQCRTLVLRFTDGTEVTALFRFK